MARSRTKAVELARLLNRASQPIYALDEDLVVVFCNRACLDWIGRSAEEAEGLRCVYHVPAESSGLEAVAAGLCPPPIATSGVVRQGVVEAPRTDRPVSRRRATFLPVGRRPNDVSGLVVLVEPEDLADSDTSADTDEATPEAVRLHERLRQFRRRTGTRFQADGLVGKSPMIRRVRARIELAIGSRRANVLVAGPPGSGRRHVAAAIHYGTENQSGSQNKSQIGSMIPLDCGVLDAELIHSTLHAATSQERSDEAMAPTTLLLVDVDRLPLGVQREVVDTLGEKSFPLRAIATTTQPLAELVGEDRFREDLAATLSTVTIGLSPLARRREDIPLLAQRFVEQCNTHATRQLVGFSSETLDRLDAYAWPGNVDELARIVAESHQRADGPEITPADLPDRIHQAAAAAARPRRVEETIVLDEFLGDIERELIQRALDRVQGNKTQAAKLLGMTRPRLYRRLIQLGLEEAKRSEAPLFEEDDS